LCETELGIHDWIPRVLVGIGLVFGLYGIGTYFQKPETHLNIASNQFAANTKVNAVQAKTATQVSPDGGVQSPTQSNNSAAQAKTPNIPTISELKTQKTAVPAVAPPEKVFFCGAQTKKGTMCSRRMKNGGRCWQHEGQPGMLPQEKLLAAQ